MREKEESKGKGREWERCVAQGGVVIWKGSEENGRGTTLRKEEQLM